MLRIRRGDHCSFSAWADVDDLELRQVLRDHGHCSVGSRLELLVRLARWGLGPPREPSADTISTLKRAEREESKKNTLNKLLRYLEAKSASREENRKVDFLAKESAFVQSQQSDVISESKRKVPSSSKSSRKRTRDHGKGAAWANISPDCGSSVVSCSSAEAVLPCSANIASFFGRSLAANLYPLPAYSRRFCGLRHVSESAGSESYQSLNSRTGDEDNKSPIEGTGVQVGSVFCDSSDDEEYRVIAVVSGRASTVVTRTQQPHQNRSKRSWDVSYIQTKFRNCG